jgi:hypothetical protein
MSSFLLLDISLSYLSRRICTYGHEAWRTGSYIEVWLKITITISIHSNTSIPHLSIFYLIPTGCALRIDLQNKRLIRFDSCLTLQNSFFFSFDIAFLLYRFRFFSLYFVFLLYRFRRFFSFSYFTDFVSFRWISFWVRQESKRNKRLFCVSTTRDIQ